MAMFLGHIGDDGTYVFFFCDIFLTSKGWGRDPRGCFICVMSAFVCLRVERGSNSKRLIGIQVDETRR